MIRRYGVPRTEAERKRRHSAIYGSSKLPQRGTGIFCRAISEAIKEEKHAGNDYRRLYGLCRRSKVPLDVCKQLDDIAGQEWQHSGRLGVIRRKACGR